jgi:hypothetical protein
MDKTTIALACVSLALATLASLEMGTWLPLAVVGIGCCILTWTATPDLDD